MTPVDDVRRRLETYFEGVDPTALDGDQARDSGRLLLTAALQALGGGEVAVDEAALTLAAMFFWYRWIEAPTGHDDPDCQTAYRLYRVLLAMAPDTTVPPELAEALSDPDNDEPIGDLLHHEARDLIDGCLHEFDDIAVELGISLGRCAVALTAPGTPEAAEHRCNLGSGLFARYLHHNDGADLDEAAGMFRAAVDSWYGDDQEQARYLANLGVVLHTRYQLNGGDQDLAEAVHLHRQALRRQPGTQSYRSQYAAVLHTRYEISGRRRDLQRAIAGSRDAGPISRVNLALMLRHRFELLSDPADLHDSITLLHEALAETSPGDPDRARRLSALGSGLTLRFTVTDDPADLDTAVGLHRDAVGCARDNDPHRLDYRSHLGHALHDRYEDSGAVADLEEALVVHAAHGSGHPVRAGNAANTRTARFDRFDRISDLDEALRSYVEAVDALPGTHIHRGALLSNLGSVWFERFQRTHDLADLAEAITADREAVRCTPSRHIDRSRRLTNLAMALDSRYARTGVPTDLDTAIDLHRDACDSAPPARRRHHASALAIALHLRFHLYGRDGDLAACIELLRDAAGCRPNHQDRPRRQTLLASALITRHSTDGDPADLAVAVTLIRAAVAATPPQHVQRAGRQTMLGSTLAKTGDPALIDEAVTVLREVAGRTDASTPPGYRLRTLGDALMDRWEATYDVTDLHAAIGAYRQAIAATTEADPDQALNRYDLAGALAALADDTDDPVHRREAVTLYRTAVAQTTTAALVRIHAAGEWAAQTLALGDPRSATEAFAAAIGLLPEVSWTGLARRDQERVLRTWNTLAADTSAAALLADRPGLAVELGDRGRSLLWEQQLRLRRDTRDLTNRHPRLAARLDHLRQRLLATNG
ncbi:tetratricopeptide repeat protein [Actinoplanes derwentensis]|uniref:Tetratricopeptide repeat-containing protein n=1 Tax=Actinoplanes derwentensis TaxID=113562 RepID=A0A1H2DDJ4_9ACTN|nr:tetratricopeptide repeat protein [Actinoplanes derwentensis]GID89636.1 hypothetical protein Ade03nite_85600 [Actinoplanes derwentensis]SDT80667.1 hypothetical protein SAMN04489716_9305 [Actinoplanes derwentensis]